jgi:hypothetical protein
MFYGKFSVDSEDTKQHTIIFEYEERLPFRNNSLVIVGSNGKSQNYVK